MAQPEIVHGNGALGVRLRGELTIDTAPALVEAIGSVARKHATPKLIIDLRDVSYLDSTCLSALLEARRVQDRQGGELTVLVVAGGHVADLFRISGTQKLLGVREDADGALESLLEG